MRDIGDLAPIRALAAELDDDARGKLEAALAQAESPVLEISLSEYARLYHIDINCAYARFRRGQIANAYKVGRRIVIPVEAGTAA